ncbi:MAG: AAA family ATPase [Chitinivibrionales bacterium]|nr:AAA family ATPase [Chitinivibrionales bacterium]
MRYQPWVSDQDWESKDPKLREYHAQPAVLRHTSALCEKIALHPEGILIVRGPRQVGKSTFLREFASKCLNESIRAENIVLFDVERFSTYHELRAVIELFLEETAGYRIVLLDELTSADEWWRALKVLSDTGALADVLVIGTGSSADDLRQGADRLPGRRGRRYPVDFELLPVRFADVHSHLTVKEFLLTGGMPWAVNEYLRLGEIPSHVYALYAGWIQSAAQRRGHLVHSLPSLLNGIVRHLSTPVSVQKLSRDCGIGSNRTAESYLALLQDNYALIPSYWTDTTTGAISPRKNRKFYPFDPLLYHLFAEFGKGWDFAYTTSLMRTADQSKKGPLIECVVAAEIRHRITTDHLGYWQGRKEIDFLKPGCIEVKYQNTVSIAEFEWASKVLPPNTVLQVITKQTNARADRIELIDLERWLLKNN